MATVHRAEMRGLAGFRKLVALKRLHPHVAEDPAMVQAFVYEARLTSRLRHWAGRSRLNLNIVRRPHAVYRASSCMRLFELAAMGCCIVSNPICGVETWFEPDRELIMAPEAEPVGPLYAGLLADEARRRALGEAARRRVLEEHTYRHRARTLLSFFGRPSTS
jgi:spore maturation protein CgeB